MLISTLSILKKNYFLFSLFLCQFISAQSPPIQWVKQMQGAGNGVYVSCMVNDPYGNVYTACNFGPKMTIGTQTIFAGGSNEICILKTDASGTLLWNKVIGGGTSHAANSMTCDAQGNLYVCGFFAGNALFGSTVQVSAGSYDGFILKMNQSGTILWSKRFGGTGIDYVRSISVDAVGKIYTTGGFEGSAGFDITNLQSTGLSDVFVMCSDAFDGSMNWIKKIGGANEDAPAAIAYGPFGNILVAGSFSVSTTIGTTTYNSLGYNDVFLVSMDASTGNMQWKQHIGGIGDDYARALTIDSHGDVYTAGSFSSLLSYGSTSLVCLGGSNVFYIKNNGISGNPVFVKSFGEIGQAHNCFAIKCNKFDQIFLTGSFNGKISIGSTTFTSLGYADIFLTEIDTFGNIAWADRKGGISEDVGTALSVDAFGNLYAGGNFAETFPYGPAILALPGEYGGFYARWGQNTTPTSIEVIKNKTALDIFPNPCTNTFTFKLETEQLYTIQLHDASGKVLFQSRSNKTEHSLDLSAFQKGIYFLSIRGEKDFNINRKIIKE